MAQKRNPSSSKTTTTKTELQIIVKKAVAGWTSDYVEGRDQLFSVGEKVRVLSIDLIIGIEIGHSEIEAAKLTNVKLQFNLPENLHMVDPTYTLGELKSATTDVRVEVYCFNSKFPYTESFEVTATYLTESTRTSALKKVTRMVSPGWSLHKFPYRFRFSAYAASRGWRSRSIRLY